MGPISRIRHRKLSLKIYDCPLGYLTFSKWCFLSASCTPYLSQQHFSSPSDSTHWNPTHFFLYHFTTYLHLKPTCVCSPHTRMLKETNNIIFPFKILHYAGGLYDLPHHAYTNLFFYRDCLECSGQGDWIVILFFCLFVVVCLFVCLVLFCFGWLVVGGCGFFCRV